MKTAFAFLLAISLFAPTQAHSEKRVFVAGATIVQCGEIEANSPIEARPEKGSHTGSLFIMDPYENPKFKAPCEKIKAKLGTRFGIQVLVGGSPKRQVANLLTKVIHPPLPVNDTDQTTEIDTWESPMNIGVPRFTGWNFEDQKELVPGKWTIQILYRDEVLAEKVFDVEILGE